MKHRLLDDLEKWLNRLGDIAVAGVDIAQYLYQLRDQELVIIIARLNPVQEMPTVCSLWRTEYSQDECPTRKAGREDAKRLIEDRLRLDGEENYSLIRDVEAWSDQHDEQET